MNEIEKTFLAKRLPERLKKCQRKEIIDHYIPVSRQHPTIRIRNIGNNHELTRKEPINRKDPSFQKETTIFLNKEEYNVLVKLPAKVVHKIRYIYKYKNRIAEIDVFLNKLKGLVLVEVEFENKREMKNFEMPDFCLADVTNEKRLAGGCLAGKKYTDLSRILEKYKYREI